MILEAYTRVFVDDGQLDPTVAFYMALLDGTQSLRFSYPETGLELVAISSPRLSVLIISGPFEARRAFEATRMTIKVDRLETVLPTLAEMGADQLEPVQTTPVGRKTRFRHPDGLVVEYVDHDSASPS